MKNGWREVIGRTIEGVVVGRSDRTPRHQVFLLFADGTSLEIYGDSFTCASGVVRGSDPERAIHPRDGRVKAVYWDGNRPRPRGPLHTGGETPAYGETEKESPDVATTEALQAWSAAKAAIEAARRV